MKKWHDDVFFGLHFDLHANENDTVLGRDLTVEHLIKELNKVKPDFVQCDCKGHPGYTSYPTRVGQPAHGIVKDALKIWREATKELGIPLIMHYSGVWDAAALRKHPEWGRVNSPKTGGNIWPKPDVDEENRDKNMTCPLSDYTDKYMIPQMLEIIDWYDVDGFWVDGENWASTPCYCEKCKALFKEKTGRNSVPEKEGEEGWKEWLKFSRENFEDHVRRYTEAVHKRKPECTVCSNWMYTVRQPDDISVPVDYISGDFDWVWSAARASVEARFMDSRGISWDLMAWGFTSYGPMKDWVFKSVQALCQEAAVVMSCGGAFMIYDTPNRSGDLVEWHMDNLAEVARFCRVRQEFCQNTRSVPQVAVMHAKEHFYARNIPLYNPGTGSQEIEGALHALLENSYHVDIMSGTDLLKRASDYPLCVIAEQENLTVDTVNALKQYVREGGSLIVSGAGPTRNFDDILGVRDSGKMAGEGKENPVYIPADKGTVCGIGEWRLVTAVEAVQVEPVLFSRDLGGRVKNSGYAAATVNKYGRGVVAGIYGPVFGTYSISHYPGVRKFIGKVIDSMKINNLMKVEAPSWINVTLREKDDSLFINFVNLGCSHPLSPKNTIVENVPPAGPVRISLPLRSVPGSAFLAPGALPVEWSYENGWFSAEIKEIGIHDILVIEKAEE